MTYNPTPTVYLADKDPCRDGRDFALQFDTMADVWDACDQPGWLFWILEHTAPLTKEESVKMSVAFTEPRLEHIPEGEDRPRKAIEDAKKWLEDPTEENRIAADAAADAADAAVTDANTAVSDADAAAYANSTDVETYVAASRAARAARATARAARHTARAAAAVSDADAAQAADGAAADAVEAYAAAYASAYTAEAHATYAGYASDYAIYSYAASAAVAEAKRKLCEIIRAMVANPFK